MQAGAKGGGHRNPVLCQIVLEFGFIHHQQLAATRSQCRFPIFGAATHEPIAVLHDKFLHRVVAQQSQQCLPVPAHAGTHFGHRLRHGKATAVGESDAPRHLSVPVGFLVMTGDPGVDNGSTCGDFRHVHENGARRQLMRRHRQCSVFEPLPGGAIGHALRFRRTRLVSCGIGQYESPESSVFMATVVNPKARDGMRHAPAAGRTRWPPPAAFLTPRQAPLQPTVPAP